MREKITPTGKHIVYDKNGKIIECNHTCKRKNGDKICHRCKLINQRKCINCACNLEIDDNRFCKSCFERIKDSKKRTIKKKREMGYCPHCLSNKPKPGFVWCDKCIENWKKSQNYIDILYNNEIDSLISDDYNG